MPMQRERYPADWEEISRRIREEAGNRCQTCGVANGAVVCRAEDGLSWYDAMEDCYFEYPSGERLPGSFETELREKSVGIVLTVAHLNDPDPMNCEPSNLAALCQMCHNRLDTPMRVRNRRRTSLAKKAAGSLFEEVSA